MKLKESNITSYCKALQILYKTIKDIDSTILIIRYQPEEEKDRKITEFNDAGVAVKARDALLNYSEAIPNYLWQIYRYFLNGRPNGKRMFSKFRLTHNVEIKDTILTLKEELDEYKFYSKIQLIQH